MKKYKKSRFLFATHLELVAVFAVIFFGGLIATPANAATEWHIKDDATGGNCTLIGNWDVVTKTCTLSQDLSQGIIIDSNNINLDGNGRTITGSNTGNGVYLSSKTGVTIKNLNVTKFDNGIYLYSSSGNTIRDNNVTLNGGVGGGTGIFLYSSSNNILAGNIALSNAHGIFLYYFSYNNTITANTVNSNNYYGIALSYFSDVNAIKGNTVNSNGWVGIYLDLASNNNLVSNNVSNSQDGIVLERSTGNVITDNTADSNRHSGIVLVYSNRDNKIYHNNFINNPGQTIVNFSGPANSGNVFNLTAPIGGNYWSGYDAPAEGCNNTNDDNFCDAPYIFNSGQDNLPWTKKDGWLAPPPPSSGGGGGGSLNQPPTLSGLEQFDGSTSIFEGWILRHPYISSFFANVSDSDGDQVKLQVELRRFGEPFTGVDDSGMLTSDLVPSGEVARVPEWQTSCGCRPSIQLPDGKYHWRARAIDSNGNKSEWQEFGGIGNVDFEILTALPDLSIERIKPIQVVEGADINDDGKVDLVANKPTVIRVRPQIIITNILDNNQVVSIELSFQNNLQSINKTIGEIKTIVNNQNGYIDFFVTPTQTGESSLSVVIDKDNSITEQDETNNQVVQELNIKRTSNLRLSYIPFTFPSFPNN
ncbi:right-handed parallel beta-helix repeat-containing protein, partial [Patescibacteria group bacterium]|nr:right-handed parallel beta-helix repeat-containing protein [Patescibacteria group bacterium]